MLALLFSFNPQTLQNFSKHQIQKKLSYFAEPVCSFRCAANTREVFHSDTLHETPFIEKKDHADSCYKNMHSVRKHIQIQMYWLHFKHAPQQSTYCCVWPSNRALSPCNNCQRLSQNISSGRVQAESSGVVPIPEQSAQVLPPRAAVSWVTQTSPNPLLLGYSTSTPRKSPVSGKGAITLNPQFPPELSLLPSMVGLLVLQNGKGSSKTKWGEPKSSPEIRTWDTIF